MKSEAQITLERKAWARGRVLVAWLKASKAAGDPALTAAEFKQLEAEMDDAVAVGQEWGTDPRRIVEEAGAAAR
jgi:hypothetical protein